MVMTSRSVFGAAGLLLLAGACGPRPGDLDYLRTERDLSRDEPDADAGGSGEGDASADAEPDAPDADADVDAFPDIVADFPDVPLEDWDTTGAGPVSGIYAVEVTVKANVVLNVDARLLYRFRLLQDGTHVRQLASMCELSLPQVRGVAELTPSDGMMRALREKVDDREGEFLSDPSGAGAEYRPDPIAIVVGAELVDMELDPLPTAEEMSAQLDEDGDGNPGVTLHSETVTCPEPEDLYIALRSVAAISGVVGEDGGIEGQVSPTLEQSVLGFSDPCLEAAARLQILINPGSTFRAIRMDERHDLDDNGNVSCDEISALASWLFGPWWSPAE